MTTRSASGNLLVLAPLSSHQRWSTITPDGPPAATSFTAPGQHRTPTTTAITGQRFLLSVPDATTTAWIMVLGPDGTRPIAARADKNTPWLITATITLKLATDAG